MEKKTPDPKKICGRENFYKQLGEKIKSKREGDNISVEELAKASSIDADTLRGYESGVPMLLYDAILLMHYLDMSDEPLFSC